MKDACFAVIALALSAAGHVPLVLSEGAEPTPKQLPPALVQLVVVPPPAAAEPEAVPPKPQPEPVPRKAPAPRKTPEPKLPEPAPELPPAEAIEVTGEPPVELTGTTLTSNLGAGWSSAAGNDAARNGAIRTMANPRSAAPRAAAPAPKPPAPVPVGELSRRPEPPALGAALERHYPPRARTLGQSGEAKVRARVEASGEVRTVTITSESSPSFGAACRAALVGSRWSAPLDRLGHRVSTWISYRCRFRAGD